MMETQEFYTITCNPSRYDKPTYTVGLFSSCQLAEKYLPAGSCMYDDEDQCLWRYAVIRIRPEEVKNIGQLDQPPREW